MPLRSLSRHPFAAVCLYIPPLFRLLLFLLLLSPAHTTSSLQRQEMYTDNGASSSVLMLASPYNRNPYTFPAGPAHGHPAHPHHTMSLNTKPAPAMPSPASFYGGAASTSYNGYNGYNTTTYGAYGGAPYPQYAAARLGASGAPSNECYLRQQRTIEIIALEEVPAPLPTRPARAHRRSAAKLNAPRQSVPASSSAASSSTCTSSSGDDDDDDDEEEEGGESYCSSEEETDPRLLDACERARVEVSFNARMRRIEQWRETYAKAVGTELAPSPSRTNSKRKGDYADADIDNRSRTSKRSRNSSSTSSTAVSTSSARSAHSCSACDTCFPDASSLKRHGAAPATNDACRAAVEYGFEGTA